MPQVFDQFVVLKPNLEMERLDVGPEFYESLQKEYGNFKSHTLISAHNFTETWPTWEVHPHGDEMVVLMSGKAEFKLRRETGDESVVLETPGSFLVIPKNTWHTAIIEEAASVLFITPGEDTQNEVLPPKMI